MIPKKNTGLKKKTYMSIKMQTSFLNLLIQSKKVSLKDLKLKKK